MVLRSEVVEALGVPDEMQVDRHREDGAVQVELASENEMNDGGREISDRT